MQDDTKGIYLDKVWLWLKAKVLDSKAYSQRIHNRLKERRYFCKVLDCGTGTGLFIQRLCDLIEFDDLIGFDASSEMIEEARKNLSRRPDIRLEVQNLYSLDPKKVPRGRDLITGQALLEHTDLNQAIAILKAWCNHDGWMYFPHNYTSPTVFEPVFDAAVDGRVVRNFDRYSIEHQSIGGRLCGDSRCGQKLPAAFADAGLDVLEFAMTDWVIYPRMGSYTCLEQITLGRLVSMFFDANVKAGIPVSERLDREVVEAWRDARLRHIAEGRLTYICPQTSILVRRP